MRLVDPRFSSVDTIIFDLGGVLLDIDISLTISAFEQLGISGLAKEDIHPHQKDFFLALELGTISNSQFIEKLKATYPGAASISDKTLWEAWNALLLDFDMKRFELLDSLRQQYRIYLLSNTNLPHRIHYLAGFLKQSKGREFGSYFHKCFYSDEMKLRKPDIAIYQQVIRETGLTPSRALFIDDNSCNFEGAIAAGLNCHHLTAGQTIEELFQ